MLLGEDNSLRNHVIQQFDKQNVEVSLVSPNEIEPSDERIKALLKTTAEQHGHIDGFLYLPGTSDVDGQLPFLFAKHLSRYFHRSTHPSRKAFVIAVSMDGKFGLTGSQQWSPAVGALPGLVKTLNQEWPWVFSRIVDIAPDLTPVSMADQILCEWVDVDTRLIEVGISSDSRHTITFDLVPFKGVNSL